MSSIENKGGEGELVGKGGKGGEGSIHRHVYFLQILTENGYIC